MVGEALHLCFTTFCGKKGQPSGPPQWLVVAQELLEADFRPSPLSQQQTLKWSTEKLHLAAISGPFDFLSFPSQGRPGIWLREGKHCRGRGTPCLLMVATSGSLPVTIASPGGQPVSFTLSLTVSFCPQDYVDAPLSIPDFLTCSLNIDWSQYQVRGPLVPTPQAPQAEV